METWQELNRAIEKTNEASAALAQAKDAYNTAPAPTSGHLVNALAATLRSHTALMGTLTHMAYRLDGLEQGTGIETVKKGTTHERESKPPHRGR